MTTERLDKQWMKSGLSGYSTAAILTTLGHYGVQVDEAGFKEASKDRYPLQIAQEWHTHWKGTGQFSKLPYAAAAELFQRVWPDRLSPSKVAATLAELITALVTKLEGKGTPDIAAAFAKANDLRAKLPENSEQLEHLMGEAVVQLGEGGSQAFDELAERLAKAGHLEDAKAFAELEEALVPDRRGVALSMVRAAAGEKDEAVRSLEAVANDSARSEDARVMALDALLHLEAHAEATKAAEAMLASAEQSQAFHLGLAVSERLGYLYEKQKQWSELEALSERVKALVAAHEAAHPGHRHHHHHG